jgi:hypothetical protein
MNRDEINRFKEDLQKANSNDIEYNRIRGVLLDGLAKGDKTREGESQHKKLENVEKMIRSNLRVKHDLEVILATCKGEN